MNTKDETSVKDVEVADSENDLAFNGIEESVEPETIKNMVPEAEKVTALALLSAEGELELANKFEITDQGSLNRGAEWGKEVNKTWKGLEEERKDMKAGALETCQKIDDKYRVPVAMFKKIQGILDGKVGGHLKEQKRIQDEEDRKALQESEDKRIKEQEKAQKAFAKGNVRKGQEHLEKIATASVPIRETAPVSKPQGITQTETWKATVVDFEALVLGVADTIRATRTGEEIAVRIPIDVLKADDSVLNRNAKSLKNLVTWPGVLFAPEHGVRRTGK